MELCKKMIIPLKYNAFFSAIKYVEKADRLHQPDVDEEDCDTDTE